MSSNNSDDDIASNINLVAQFVADLDTEPLTSGYEIDTIVICASAVLHGAEVIFRRLQDGSLVAKTLVLCGGVGHSTKLIWDAVAGHPEYSVLGNAVQGKPEARVLEMILNRFFDTSRIKERGCRILIEDRSTNCGANAAETRKVLEAADGNDALSVPSQIMIVQDPTMALRTRASFEKVYDNVSRPPTLINFPVFIPKVEVSKDRPSANEDTIKDAEYQFNFFISEIPKAQLWDMSRFIELIIGEIPRLRDDENGYGPNGRNFISHVDVPRDVEDAWKRLKDSFGTSRCWTARYLPAWVAFRIG